MRKFLSIFLLIVLVASNLSSLLSCSAGEDVSVLYYTYSDTYISSVRSAMDKSLKSNGTKYHNYDADGNQTRQTEQVDTAITKGAKLLAVNVVDTGSADAASAIVSKAKAKNIPLIFFNRSVSDEVISSYDKCVFVGTDYEEAGRIQGEMIGKYLVENYEKLDLNGDGKISYVLFKGQQGNLEAEARTKYSVEYANKALTEAGLQTLKFYDDKNTNKYIVDQNGTWSNAAANNAMKTLLSAYSEANKNMVELVIANNDEMALGALAALEEAGYNKSGEKHIPVFGVDATDGAVAKIKSGAMTGTVKQDGALMANTIAKIAGNMLAGKNKFDGIDDKMKVNESRINIPYSVYTATDTSEEK